MQNLASWRIALLSFAVISNLPGFYYDFYLSLISQGFCFKPSFLAES